MIQLRPHRPQPAGCDRLAEPVAAMIELGDGLQADEVIELARKIDVKRLLSPQLQNQLNGGINALLTISPMLDKVPPFLLGFLPLPPGWRDSA